MTKNYSLFTKIGLMIFSAVLLFSACTEEKYYTDPDTVTLWEVFDAPVGQNQWKWNSQNGYYEYEIRDNRINETAVDVGGLQVAKVINNDFYRPLPCTSYYSITGTNKTISETIDFEYGVGWIHLYITASDFASYDIQSMNFKITLWW